MGAIMKSKYNRHVRSLIFWNNVSMSSRMSTQVSQHPHTQLGTCQEGRFSWCSRTLSSWTPGLWDVLLTHPNVLFRLTSRRFVDRCSRAGSAGRGWPARAVISWCWAGTRCSAETAKSEIIRVFFFSAWLHVRMFVNEPHYLDKNKQQWYKKLPVGGGGGRNRSEGWSAVQL